MATLSQNVTQAISDFTSIKTAIENKGVTVPAGTPTSDYAELIDDIPEGDESVFIGVIERTATSITIPTGTTKINSHIFADYDILENVSIPEGVEEIETAAFSGCYNLATIDVPTTLKHIGSMILNYTAFFNKSSNWTNNKILYLHTLTSSPLVYYCIASKNLGTGFSTDISLNSYTKVIAANAFSYSRDLRQVSLNSGLEYINDRAFAGSPITTINFPNSLIEIGEDVFDECSYLENVTIGDGFNCDNLNLSASTRYSAATIANWLNALADRTSEIAYTLTIGSTNIAKLTAEQIAIATDKNWNLA